LVRRRKDAAAQPPERVLTAAGLDVTFTTQDGVVEAVKGVSFHVDAGEVLGIVGESGSGKSQMVLAAMGLLASNGRVKGSIKYRGTEILGLAPKKLNRVRGSKMTMIFQDPLTSLTPHMRCGRQITEVLTEHMGLSQRAADKRALEMLELVRITEAKRRLQQYPHELSGGMRQRIMIAMAMVCQPDLLIADEPTTALDVTVQAQILDLMRDLQRELGTAVILITHDMGVVAGMCDRIQVMRYGEFVEAGDARSIFYSPQHEYTKMLIAAMPRIDNPNKHGLALNPISGDGKPLLEVDDIKVHFPIRVGTRALILPKFKPLRAVDGVSLSLAKGETLGIVGESGCGKSTLARGILQLVRPTAGDVVWLGNKITRMGKGKIRRLRKEFQIVFQDPLASLDPRMTIGQSIAEPLRTHRHLSARKLRGEVKDMMERVGLDPLWINRYPHEFSGGQNQRVGIARAMILKPKLIVCDEAVSALDVSIQAQIIKLLLVLQSEFGMSMLFISHDLAIVREMSHRVMVLFLGRVVELADRTAIYERPDHPYTKALISAVPVPDPDVERAKPRLKLEGELPSPLDTRSQLMFLKSKMIDDPEAEQYIPQLIEIAPGHFVAEHD
jgi:oligopeptide/dipeptide ABC transporter ATP-binding protein